MNAHKAEMMLNNRQEASIIEVGYRPRGPLKRIAFGLSLALVGAGIFEGVSTGLSERHYIKEKTIPKHVIDSRPFKKLERDRRSMKISMEMPSNIFYIPIWMLHSYFRDPPSLIREDSIRDARWERYRNPEAHYANAFHCLLGGTGLYLASRRKELYRQTE